jgi:hypothetical protein
MNQRYVYNENYTVSKNADSNDYSTHNVLIHKIKDILKNEGEVGVRTRFEQWGYDKNFYPTESRTVGANF